MSIPCLSTPRLNWEFLSLSVEQKYAFAKFIQGHNLFITGPGGTGKTRLIQFMVEYMNSIGKSHQVCALTGCAATLLNCKAKTIHSWSGIKLAKGDPENIIRRVVKGRCYPKAWRGVDVLIVDEVSMMSRKMFEILDQIGRTVRKMGSKPFGGIQLIFTGDFFQLPPIPDQDDPTSGEFCFQHPRWCKTFKPENCIELKTFFRQTDPTYISILQEVRRGTISPSNIQLLQTRLMRENVLEELKDGIVPTKLFPVRTKVETINETSYEKLKGEEVVYNFTFTTKAKVHIDSGTALFPSELSHCEELTSEQLSQEIDNLITSLLTEKTIRLKIGALVMCTANIDMEKGICNGSQGIVIGYSGSISTLPEDLMTKKSTTLFVPVVRFANGVILKVAPYQRQSEEFPCVIVSQIPLCLAWALTIHKIQGATLDMAEIDIGRSIFAPGQSYVALSRVKTLEGLYLSEFYSTKIKANPIVIEFYDSFPQLEKEEMERQTNEIMAITKPAVQAVELKQSSMQTFLATATTANPFEHLSYSESRELEEEPIEQKDPTIKTIKLSKY